MIKKIALVVFLLNFVLLAHAQKRGLEQIIVEKYYISDVNDAKADKIGGILPVGSVTYRIFVDLLPGYRFQAAYGLKNHELRIATSTHFFNNIDMGDIIPNIIPDNNLKNNTVMLDSWLSVGGASESMLGILKIKDNGKGTIIHENGLLSNANPEAGIPLTKQDGLINGNVPKVTGFGIDSLMKEHFGKLVSCKNGPVFSTINGSWACLGGSIGPDSLENQILIAQITTDGDFSFELNIQIGTPWGGVENYVARNPVGEEIQFDGLIYKSSSISNKKQKNKHKQ